MPFNDYECKCGKRYEDQWATTAAAVKRSVKCECGKQAAMVFDAPRNGIHFDHSSMYGQWNPSFGQVVESYGHKQQLMREYDVHEASDAKGGSRCHITSDYSESKDDQPRERDPGAWGNKIDAPMDNTLSQ